MSRSILIPFLVVGLSTAGCSDPELEKRISDLEAKIDTLEKRGVAAGPAGAAPTASPEDEQAAAALLKEATDAIDKMDFETAKAKVAEIKAKFGHTRAAKAVARIDQELEVVGKDQIPLTTEKWYAGSAADLEGGQATVYVFWETWCPHCRREVPRLTEVYNKYNSKGLRMVGLTKQTKDVTDQQVADFVKENAVSYPIAKEQGDTMSQHYGVRGIPAAAVVKNGKVIWRGHPAKLTDQVIEGWL